MAMKEPSKEELTEAIIFITDRWQAFGDELIDVIKHTPLENRYIFQSLTNKYNEACRTLASMIEKWPNAPSHKKPVL